jgi:uncharacterized protein Yka (UPF0111/DUF47 family)
MGLSARYLARLARDLSGRSAQAIVDQLVRQLSCTERAAEVALALTCGSMTSDEARERLRRLEHEGDEARSRLVSELAHVLATPIDAEDIFRFSRSLDDVLDNLRDFVREVDLYQPSELGFARPLCEALLAALSCLRPAVTGLASSPASVREGALATRKAAHKGRRLYEQQLAELFKGPVGTETLKQRELLRRLDVVALRLGEAADALADGALKRSR